MHPLDVCLLGIRAEGTHQHHRQQVHHKVLRAGPVLRPPHLADLSCEFVSKVRSAVMLFYMSKFDFDGSVGRFPVVVRSLGGTLAAAAGKVNKEHQF